MGLFLVFVLAVWFGFLAFLIAFLIIHLQHEKDKSHRNRLIKEPLMTALMAFAIFFILAVFVGYLFLIWRD